MSRIGSGKRGQTLSGAVAALFVLGAFGVFSVYARNGYADPLWAALVVGAVVAGLVAPIDGTGPRVAFLLTAAAALVKSDAQPVALVVMALTTVRHPWRSRPITPRGLDLARAAAPAAGVASVVLAWFLLLSVHGVSNRYQTRSAVAIAIGETPDAMSRVVPTIVGVGREVPLLVPAVMLALLGGRLARRNGDTGLGSLTWPLAVAAFALMLLMAAYVVDPYPVDWLLATSAGRTTDFVNLVLIVVVAGPLLTIARRASGDSS